MEMYVSSSYRIFNSPQQKQYGNIWDEDEDEEKTKTLQNTKRISFKDNI